MAEHVEHLKNSFELKMEEAKADARFLAGNEKSDMESSNMSPKKNIMKYEK